MSNPNPIIPQAPETPGGITKYQGTSSMGNPRMAAMQAGINNGEITAKLANSGGARRRRKYRGGQANTGQGTTTGQSTTILQQGPPILAKDPNPNTPFGTTNLTNSMQVNQLDQNAQAKLDSSVAPPVPVPTKGGRRTKKWGGFHKWGCYSGGKRKSRRHSKKSSRKSRKTRRK
jgi:hypothetical protein